MIVILFCEAYQDFLDQTNYGHEDPRVGLAVIIGVVENGPEGSENDIDNVKSTFNKSLNFATWVIKDPSLDKIRKVAQIVSEYSLFSIHLRGVVVYYSGHGGSKNGKEYFALASDIFDSNELTSPFEPANPKCRLEDRYRLFLFDCCFN